MKFGNVKPSLAGASPAIVVSVAPAIVVSVALSLPQAAKISVATVATVAILMNFFMYVFSLLVGSFGGAE